MTAGVVLKFPAGGRHGRKMPSRGKSIADPDVYRRAVFKENLRIAAERVLELKKMLDEAPPGSCVTAFDVYTRAARHLGAAGASAERGDLKMIGKVARAFEHVEKRMRSTCIASTRRRR